MHIPNHIKEVINRLMAQHEKKKCERRAFMATRPQIIRCRRHPDCERRIDEHLTARATADNFGILKAGYTRCPKCLESEMLDRLQKCGVPENLLHATYENFKPTTAEEAKYAGVAREFCEVKRGFLILLGGYGTGKSHLATATLRCYGRGWFVRHNSLLLALRATYRDNSAFNPIDRAQSTRLLVLDEVGLSAGGKDELPMLHEILGYRHTERLPTIITSNLPYTGLTSVLGERMADRLRESTYRVLKFSGASHRHEAHARYFETE